MHESCTVEIESKSIVLCASFNKDHVCVMSLRVFSLFKLKMLNLTKRLSNLTQRPCKRKCRFRQILNLKTFYELLKQYSWLKKNLISSWRRSNMDGHDYQSGPQANMKPIYPLMYVESSEQSSSSVRTNTVPFSTVICRTYSRFRLLWLAIMMSPISRLSVWLLIGRNMIDDRLNSVESSSLVYRWPRHL